MALGTISTLAALGAGAGAGALKHLVSDAPRAARQRKLAAETQRYSPWTKMQAGPVEDPSLFGNIIGGAGYGLAAQAPINDAIAKYGSATSVPGFELPDVGSQFVPSKQFNLGIGNLADNQSGWTGLLASNKKPSLYGG